MNEYLLIHKSLLERLIEHELEKKKADEMVKEIKKSILELQKEFVNECTD